MDLKSSLGFVAYPGCLRTGQPSNLRRCDQALSKWKAATADAKRAHVHPTPQRRRSPLVLEAITSEDAAVDQEQHLEEKEFGMGPSWPAYLALFAAQILPFIDGGNLSDIVYFVTTATMTLFIGCHKSTQAAATETIQPKMALVAPLFSSAYLFGIYCLLKFTNLDIGAVFLVTSSFLGTLCLANTFRPILETLSPPNLRELSVDIPRLGSSKPDSSSAEALATTSKWKVLDLASIAGASTVAGLYLTHQAPNFMYSNILAWGIGVEAVSLVRPASFLVAAGLLCGLFFYDIFWVFGGDVMLTVATKIDAPAKFLFPKDLSHLADPSSAYPYSVLGLGDIVVPAIFASVSLMLDRIIVNGEDPAEVEPAYVASGPYFSAAVVGYLLGLGATFIANSTTKAAQPALLYLVPALIGSALITAARRGELRKVIDFKTSVEPDLPLSDSEAKQ